jgi:hypothetical protein
MRIIRRRLPDGVHSQNDGVTVTIDDRLNAAAMFVALQHELIHIERGHVGHPRAAEMEVRLETAVRCLPVDALAGTCHGRAPVALARELGVTPDVLEDRAATLTEAEAGLLGCASCRVCSVMKYRFAPRP